MADGNHIRCADIEKLVQFEKDSQVAKTDFDNIIKEFKRITKHYSENGKVLVLINIEKRLNTFLKKSEVLEKFSMR